MIRKLGSKGLQNSLYLKPFTVLVEGNIGSGKTTFLETFKDKNFTLIAEPVDEWRSVGKEKHNLLDLMYENPERWSMTFQIYVFKTLLNNHLIPTTSPVKIMERSIYSARFCFIEALKNTRYLSSPEYSVLDEWYKWITTNIDLHGDFMS